MSEKPKRPYRKLNPWKKKKKRNVDWNDPVQVAKYYKQYAKENKPRLKKYRHEYWTSADVRTRTRKQYAEMDPKKKEKQLKKAREYGSSPKGREVFYKRYHRDPDKHHAYRNKGYEKVKREVFSGLSGGEPKCAHCKETEFLFLTIHHVFGRKTAKEKKRKKREKKKRKKRKKK